MGLLDSFRAHLATLPLPSGSALVAVSGGPDSVVLLDLLVQTQELHGLSLVVAHADHGIHPDSGKVAERVRALAASYGLPYKTEQLQLGPSAGETLARARRYAWLEDVRLRVGASIIVTAHHADDQVETVLMRVLSGSGPAGLAGMTAVRGKLVRPLLRVSRAELAEYAQERGLQAWVDPANSDPRHLRSWIRTQLLPQLRGRLPQIDTSLQRVSRQAGIDRAAWDALLDLLPGLNLRAENEGISVAASSLGDYDSALTQAVLLALARRVGCRLGPSRVGRVFDLLRTGESGMRVPLGGNWTAALEFGRLRILPLEAEPTAAPWSLAEQRGEGSWGRWTFRWQPATAPGHQDRVGLSAWFTPDPLTVRRWSPGEKVKPLGGTGRRLVVRCFQEVRVPRSRRGSWPVLAQSNDVLWIPGVCRSGVRLPAEGTEALRVDAEYT
ncbi:MAG TPA: tRNA lysidine(34) synthetase TilS [Gemmatimonadales bacterium]|nr:tRNA lysidine(34) synthetase TilS [Gemmatimonadales bacterium]